MSYFANFGKRRDPLVIHRSIQPRIVHPLIQHPTRPVCGPLLRYPDGHYSVRTRYWGTHHGVDRKFGKDFERRKKR